MAPFLTLERLTKTFGAQVAVADLSLAVSAGEILCLLGPSGCGKSTLLRLIAGLQTITSGHIIWPQDPRKPHEIGFVFRSRRFFPGRMFSTIFPCPSACGVSVATTR